MRPPKPPDVEATGFQAALRGLKDWRWIKGGDHRDLVRFTDLTFASSELQQHINKLLRRAAKMGIPLMCESASFDVAFISHSRRRRELQPLEWEIIGHLGTEIATQYRLGVRWAGLMMPAVWMGGWKPSLPRDGSPAPPLQSPF